MLQKQEITAKTAVSMVVRAHDRSDGPALVPWPPRVILYPVMPDVEVLPLLEQPSNHGQNPRITVRTLESLIIGDTFYTGTPRIVKPGP